MEKIYAAEANFITEFLAKTENATEADRKAAEDIYGKEIKESIFTYSEDSTEAHISVCGPLSRSGPTPLHKYFGYGGTSYFEIIESIKIAENDDLVRKIVFDIDTGGGEVFGVDQVQQAIMDCDKKTVAINHGLIASAGYYIASACDKIYAMEPLDMIGSVGVVIISVDVSKMQEEYGIKVVEVVSRYAPNKRPDVKTKTGKSILQAEADAIENVFMTRVAQGRRTTLENVRENFGKGALLVAENPDGPDATKAGMIDGVYKKESTAKEADDDGTHVPEISTPEGEYMEEPMNLTEFLASNPDAKEAYKAEMTAKYNAGVEAGKAEVQARVDRVAPIMASESYDVALKTQAQKALKGELSLESFESVVAMEDMRIQREKSTTAQEETTNLQETPGQTPAALSGDGSINSEDDYQAAIARSRESIGIGGAK